MTDQGTHVPTAQETAIYDALTAGDQDAIDQLRADAIAADPTPPDPLPDGWLSPIDQFEQDYGYAWSHYQADHEAPEPEREASTRAQADVHNADAADEPPPTYELYGLDPKQMNQSTGDQRLRAMGIGFTAAAIIVLDGRDQTTGFASANEVQCMIHTDTKPPKVYEVRVRQDDVLSGPYRLTLNAA